MKKFQFPLNTVLDYKDQILDSLQNEHGIILAQVHRQEEALRAAREHYTAYNEEYRARKAEGLTVAEALKYQNGLDVLEQRIQRETGRLAELRRREEEKREQVVEARKETAVIEHLRDRRVQEYQKEVQKQDEILIDEFVSMSRVVSASGE